MFQESLKAWINKLFMTYVRNTELSENNNVFHVHIFISIWFALIWQKEKTD